MDSYQNVVQDRYNTAEKTIHTYDSMYSMINPIGFYGAQVQKKAYYDCFNYFRKRGMDITQAKILDVGCGKGFVTRFFAELTQNPSLIYGTDLSNFRIDEAKRLNSSIHYSVDDVVSPTLQVRDFDIISAIDVFMHLKTKEQIMQGLNGIHAQLSTEGYFIWYDAYAKDHFSKVENKDHEGFHPKQMKALAREAGFVLVYEKSLFKRILWKYHSLYLIKRLPKYLVRICEVFFPGTPGNMIYIFKKA